MKSLIPVMSFVALLTLTSCAMLTSWKSIPPPWRLRPVPHRRDLRQLEGELPARYLKQRTRPVVVPVAAVQYTHQTGSAHIAAGCKKGGGAALFCLP